MLTEYYNDKLEWHTVTILQTAEDLHTQTQTLRWRDGDSRTLRAARSRCVSPRSAMCSMPRAIWPHMVMRWATLSGGSRPLTAGGGSPQLLSFVVARRNVLRSPCNTRATTWRPTDSDPVKRRQHGDISRQWLTEFSLFSTCFITLHLVPAYFPFLQILALPHNERLRLHVVVTDITSNTGALVAVW